MRLHIGPRGRHVGQLILIQCVVFYPPRYWLSHLCSSCISQCAVFLDSGKLVCYKLTPVISKMWGGIDGRHAYDKNQGYLAAIISDLQRKKLKVLKIDAVHARRNNLLSQQLIKDDFFEISFQGHTVTLTYIPARSLHIYSRFGCPIHFTQIEKLNHLLLELFYLR